MTKTFVLFLLAAAGFFVSMTLNMPSAENPPLPDAAALRAMAARFAPVEIGADLSALPLRERQALAKIVRAGLVMDALFLRQVWAGNEAVLLALLKDESALGKARLHYFLVNKGPWSRLDHNSPFIPGVPAKPEGANFYPADAAKAELEARLETLSAEDKARATGFFTTIRRRGTTQSFRIVSYSEEYQAELRIAAELLREAASFTSQATLKTFLEKRAASFLSNDYYDSDVAWMELDASIEPTIGPYEVYEDGLFNAKAAFESFIAIRDDRETAKLAMLGSHLQDVEDHLPIDPRYRNPKLGALAPIRVVNEILASGDGNRAVQTTAFNLPNDERVIREKGSKRVMLRNVQEAKFRLVLIPIARLVLAAADQGNVSFDSFFTHTVTHELMHGLGPHEITVAGRATTVRQELKETYSTIEEAKADISGLFALQHLVDRGVLDKSLQKTMYDTFLASAFRSIRFGVSEAHGRGTAIQLNYLLDHGSFRVNRDGTYSVDGERIREGVAGLTRDIMTLQAEGSYAKAREMLTRLGVVRPEIQRVLDRMKSIPVDIEPSFTSADQLLRETGY
jgi:hypothetical protein